MSIEELHDALDALTGFHDGLRSSLRMTVHALIDLGVVTSIECSWEGCQQVSRTFVPSVTKSDRPSKTGAPRKKVQAHDLVMSIDHKEQFAKGGSDRPGNLRIVHLICNIQMGRQLTAPHWSTSARESVSAASKERWTNEQYRRKMSIGMSTRNRQRWQAKSVAEREAANAKVSEGLKRAWQRRRAAALDVSEVA